MNKLGEEIQESLNKFIGCPKNEDTMQEDMKIVLEDVLGEHDTQNSMYSRAAGFSNVTSTSTSNTITSISSLNSTGNTIFTVQPYYNGVNTIFNGYNSVVQKETYEILGKKVELDIIWDKNIINSIALINIHGYKFYNELKKNHIDFPIDLEEAIEKIIKVLERDDKISAICA